MLEIDYTLLGERLRSYRRQQKLSQEALAERAGISCVYLSHIENSRSIPSLETLVRLCRALAITPDSLLLGADSAGETYLNKGINGQFSMLLPSERRLVNGFIQLLLKERPEA